MRVVSSRGGWSNGIPCPPVINLTGGRMGAMAFFMQRNNATRLVSFCHDVFVSMVNYAISDIAQRLVGVETGVENATDIEGQTERTVYRKNFHVVNTPHIAATQGLKYWWVNINGKWFDKIYCNRKP